MRLFKRLRNQSGQGMTEYIIIVALIAIAAIAAFTYFGKAVRTQTAVMTDEVAGKDSDTAKKGLDDAEKGANEEAAANKNLSDYMGGSKAGKK